MHSTTKALHAVLALAIAAASPGTARAQTAPPPLRAEVESLNAAMIAAWRKDPASVAGFYTDDASIIGGGGRWVGRAQIDAYWKQAGGIIDWKLEVIEVGGGDASPWQRGISMLSGAGGRTQRTEFIGILKRQPNGELKLYVDMYVAAPASSGGGR